MCPGVHNAEILCGRNNEVPQRRGRVNINLRDIYVGITSEGNLNAVLRT